MKCKLCLMKVVDVRSVFSGVLQGSLLGPPLYLIYINDLPDGITSLCKIFADDTLHFSMQKISLWACQWKMPFNSDPNKQIIFFHKSDSANIFHLPSKFNNKCSS